MLIQAKKRELIYKAKQRAKAQKQGGAAGGAEGAPGAAGGKKQQ